MKSKVWFMWLCAAGLALLVQPAFGQPRGRGGPEERDKAVQEQPTAREQALEQEVRELRMQLKRLQEALGPAQARPEARPSLGEPAQRSPGQAPARAESLAGASEPGFMGGRGGRGGRGGMGRGMPGGPGWQGPPMAQRPAMGPGAQAGRIAPQNVAAQVRRILDEARMLIARAEQLLARQGPPTEGYGAFPQPGGGRGEGLRGGRGGPGGRGRGGAFGPPAGARGGGRYGPPPSQGY